MTVNSAFILCNKFQRVRQSVPTLNKIETLSQLIQYYHLLLRFFVIDKKKEKKILCCHAVIQRTVFFIVNNSITGNLSLKKILPENFRATLFEYC